MNEKLLEPIAYYWQDEKTAYLLTENQKVPDGAIPLYAETLQPLSVGELRCDATTGHVYGVYWYESAPSLGTKVYTVPQPSDADAKLKIAVEALQGIIYGTYHRDRGFKCADGKFSWEDCEQCIDRHVMQALEKIGVA